MHGSELAGPGIIFFQVLMFALVLGALAMMVHALTRKADRWRHPWMRFVWVALGAAWCLAVVFALIWRNDITFTVVGISFVVILVTEVAYLLRVVFPAPERTLPADVLEPVDSPASEKPESPEDLTFE